MKSWVDVIAIEYKKLSTKYPFKKVFQPLATDNTIRLLDVGCGTAIFPGYLDRVLDSELKIVSDLLDISEASLKEASTVLTQLTHFEVGKVHQGLIEEIPGIFNLSDESYDIIWAIHSFTTVDIDRMPKVYSHLIKMLAKDGLLLVYQLARESTYQVLHRYYRSKQVKSDKLTAYMEFEDSIQILDQLAARYSVQSFNFSHKIEESRTDLLKKYLKKVILDDQVEVLEFFSPILPKFYVPKEKQYRFPQTVNLLTIKK